MTPDEQRAEALVNTWNRKAGGVLRAFERESLTASITAALRGERIKGMEEAAKLVDKVVDERTVQLRGMHVEPMKGWVECKLSEAQRIAQAIREQARRAEEE